MIRGRGNATGAQAGKRGVEKLRDCKNRLGGSIGTDTWNMARTTALVRVGNLLVIFACITMISGRLSNFRTAVVMIVMYPFCTWECSFADINEGEEYHSYMKHQAYHTLKLHIHVQRTKRLFREIRDFSGTGGFGATVRSLSPVAHLLLAQWSVPAEKT